MLPRLSVGIYCIYRYVWKKDGQRLDTGSGQSKYIVQPPGGTIIIKSPSTEDDGVYQCFAHNEFGTAVSIRTRVQRAGATTILRIIIKNSLKFRMLGSFWVNGSLV